MTTTTLARVTDQQLEELITRIAASPYGDIEVKKALIWFLLQTENLSRKLLLIFPNTEMGQQVCIAVDKMNKRASLTRLDDLLQEFGIGLRLCPYVSWLAFAEQPTDQAGIEQITYDRELVCLQVNLEKWRKK